MNQELYTYIQRMHTFIQAQEKRIIELERNVKSLSDDLKNIKSRPPIQVDTIEYKFDQLKVETLEGTLNIGLNPSDLENIEDFAVQNKGISTNFSPKEKMQRSMELEDSIHSYLDNELQPLIKKYEQQLEITVKDEYIGFIKEDIKKQLPQRIEHYMKKLSLKGRSAESHQKMIEQIEEQMKKDIENAVLTFLRNLPSEPK